MSRRLIYMAHPVAPTAEDLTKDREERNGYPHEQWLQLNGYRDEQWLQSHQYRNAVYRAVQSNLQSALRWLAWLRASFPETTFIAPWIAGVQSVGSDGTPEEREAGMVDCCAVVERCDGIVLVGGRISSGMRREMEHGLKRADRWIGQSPFEVYDLTPTRINSLIKYPTWSVLTGSSLHDWYAAIAMRSAVPA